MLRISVAPAIDSSPAGGPGCPDVLAHRQTDAPGGTRAIADVDHGAALAGVEVALLVEHAVVGQVDLAVDRMDRTVGEHCGGVVDVLGALGKAHDGDRALRIGRELVQRRCGVGEEVLAQQQILGRVAGQGKLGKQHQIGALGHRRLAPCADALGVAGDVADRGVHLTEGQAHLSSRARCARRRYARRRLCACAALRRSWPAVWRAGSRRPRGRASRSPT